MLHIALFEPEIPPNTGNIMRLCANTGAWLHLVEPLGFDLEEKSLRRAGLDYRDTSRLTRHANWQAFKAAMGSRRILALTTHGEHHYSAVRYMDDDVLLFGAETRGLPPHVHASLPPGHRLRIPMLADSRSLNLSNAVAVVTYEALRQQGFTGLV